jgi:hypothetical protein
VPRQLSADKQATRVTNAKEHLSRFNREEDKFLNRITLEMRCGFIIPNLRQNLIQTSGNELAPHLLKSLSCLSFDWQSHACCLLVFTRNYTYSFHAKGQTVTAKYYSEEIPKNFREKLKQMRPRLAQKKCPLSSR